MRQKSSPRPSSGKRWIWLVLFILLCISIGVSWYIFKFLRIQTITVIEKNKPQSVITMPFRTSSLDGTNLLLTTDKRFIDLVKEANPIVESATVVKQFPDTLHITVTFYTPVAAIASDNGFLLLASDGAILSKKKLTNLPQIKYYQIIHSNDYQIGQRIDFKDILFALRFLKTSLDLNLKVTKIDIKGYHMIGLYTQDKEILLTIEKDADTQEYQYRTIVTQFKSEDKKFRKLDLRFDKPVVVIQ